MSSCLWILPPEDITMAVATTETVGKTVAVVVVTMLVAHSVSSKAMTLDCWHLSPLPRRRPTSQGKHMAIYVAHEPSSSGLLAEAQAVATSDKRPVVLLYQGSVGDNESSFTRASNMNQHGWWW